MVGDDAAIVLDLVAALEHAAQRLGAGDNDRRVLHEQREEPILLRHQRLEPAEHGGLIVRVAAE